MFRILARNIVSNWIGFAVQAVVAFLLTPFVLHSLGDTRYGIWALVMGLTGYYGLLDLGFRAGITQYLTRHLATRDFAAMNRVASTAVAALGACGALIVLLAGGLCWLAPHLFNLPPETVAETRWCIAIIGVSSAISFAFFTYSAVFAATQRYDLANAISIGVRLLSATATVVALRQGYGLVGLSVLNAVGELLGYVLRMRVAYWILPELRIAPRLAAWRHLWSITTYGVWSFLSQSAVQLRSYAGIFVIGLFLPIAAVTPFNLANQVVLYFDMLFAPMAIVFFPAATRLNAQGDFSGLRRMYLAGSRIMLLLAVALGAIAAIWAEDFFRLWVGTAASANGAHFSVALLFQVLLATELIATGQKIGIQVFLASRRLRFLTFLLSAEALLNLGLSIVLIQFYGLLGVTLGILIPAIIFQGILQPAVLCRFLKISAFDYLREVYLRPVLVGIVLFSSLIILRGLMPAIDQWSMLFLNGALAGGLALAVLASLGLESGERQRFLLEPLRRLKARFRFGIPQDNPLNRPPLNRPPLNQ